MHGEYKFDVVVVGAGPAGSSTAKSAADNGMKVLLIDRKMEVGVPNKCGEFLPSLQEMRRLAPKASGLEDIFDPPDRYIVNRTERVRFVFPNGTEITVPFKGVVVERKLYDKHLANEAARAGAEVSPMTRCLTLLGNGKGLRIRNVDSEIDVHAKVVVGADGADSRIARGAGLAVSRDPLDHSVGYQYEMVNVEHDPRDVEMYFGRDYAPGTYAWIIPKGDDVANVGTGVRTPFMTKGMSVRDYQRDFLEKHPIASEKLKHATPTAIKAGNIPVGGPLQETCRGNVIVVGDAAGQTIPTVGGGIPTALICGKIAGEAIAKHINYGEPLKAYEREWRSILGETLDNSLRLRRMGDVLFGSEKTMDFITRRGWLNEEMVENLILCRMDAKMKLAEKTLLRIVGKLG